MSRKKTPSEVEGQVIAGLRAGKTWREVEDETGVSATTISRIRRECGLLSKANQVKAKDGVSTNLGEYNGTVDIDVTHPIGKPPRWLDVTNPEELVRACEIDTRVWVVTSCRVSTSEVTMKLHQSVGKRHLDVPKTYTNVHVSVQLRKRKVAERAILGFVDRLLKSPYKPRQLKKARVRQDSVLLEWCPYDQHHGMLAWGPEVDESYDLKISADFFAQAVVKVLDTAANYRLGQIVIPIGQDWFHCNDPSNETPFAKHHLDVEGRLIKVFETGYWALFKAIEQFRQVAPVHILWVPGNHDPETSYYLVRALAAHYMDLDGNYRKGVTADFTPRSRKVYSWGNSCIGFSHPISKGSWEKQRGIFSEVFKREWADARYHEIHTGHLHKVMEYSFMQADTLGSHTVIRMLPSLCATDKWHWEQGFVEKNRASASFIWSKNEGLVCQYTTRVSDERK